MGLDIQKYVGGVIGANRIHTLTGSCIMAKSFASSSSLQSESLS